MIVNSDAIVPCRSSSQWTIRSTQPKTVGSYNYHPLFPEPTHTIMPVPAPIGGKRIALAIDEERNDFEIAIPNLASLILTHELDGRFPGLKEFKPDDRPPIFPVFIAFRLMVGLGVLMIAIGWVGAWLWLRGRKIDALALYGEQLGRSPDSIAVKAAQTRASAGKSWPSPMKDASTTVRSGSTGKLLDSR